MTSENSKQLAVTPLHSHNGLETPQKSAHVKPSIMSLSPEKDGETSDQDSESDLTDTLLPRHDIKICFPVSSDDGTKNETWPMSKFMQVLLAVDIEAGTDAAFRSSDLQMDIAHQVKSRISEIMKRHKIQVFTEKQIKPDRVLSRLQHVNSFKEILNKPEMPESERLVKYLFSLRHLIVHGKEERGIKNAPFGGKCTKCKGFCRCMGACNDVISLSCVDSYTIMFNLLMRIPELQEVLFTIDKEILSAKAMTVIGKNKAQKEKQEVIPQMENLTVSPQPVMPATRAETISQNINMSGGTLNLFYPQPPTTPTPSPEMKAQTTDTAVAVMDENCQIPEELKAKYKIVFLSTQTERLSQLESGVLYIAASSKQVTDSMMKPAFKLFVKEVFHSKNKKISDSLNKWCNNMQITKL